MIGETPTNPGLEVHFCMSFAAHGPHEWDFNQDVKVWCDGIRAHHQTMIGQGLEGHCRIQHEHTARCRR